VNADKPIQFGIYCTFEVPTNAAVFSGAAVNASALTGHEGRAIETASWGLNMVRMLIVSRSATAATVMLALLLSASTSTFAQKSSYNETRPNELRVAVVMSNSALAVRGPDGQISGLAIDLGKALAARGPVDLKLVPYENIVRFNQSLGKDDWDVAFVPRDLSRTSQIAFSDAWLEVDNGYVTRPGLSVRTPDEVDRAGTKVAVSQGSPLDSALSRTLKQAEIVRIPAGFAEAREALAFRRADVLAETMPMAYRVAAEVPGATVVVGRLSSLKVVVAVPKKDAANLADINAFLRDSKRDGVLAEAIKKANLRGVRSPRS
jgi:polar amino acid transport system substrate-binding protein